MLLLKRDAAAFVPLYMKRGAPEAHPAGIRQEGGYMKPVNLKRTGKTPLCLKMLEKALIMAREYYHRIFYVSSRKEYLCLSVYT